MPIEISKPRLQCLLVKFKKEAYAEDGKYEPTPYGTKIRESKMDCWNFTDEYCGDARFAGMELLSQSLTGDVSSKRGSFTIGKIVGIWNMTYYGGLISEDIPKYNVFEFLKYPLKAVPLDLPFRGPIGRFSNKDFPDFFCKKSFCGFEYQNELVEGSDVTNATGVEKILFDGKEVYKLHWSGGLLMKDLRDVALV
jgi:hypothetical protein